MNTHGIYLWVITTEFFCDIHLNQAAGANPTLLEWSLSTSCFHCIQLKPASFYIDYLNGWSLLLNHISIHHKPLRNLIAFWSCLKNWRSKENWIATFSLLQLPHQGQARWCWEAVLWPSLSLNCLWSALSQHKGFFQPSPMAPVQMSSGWLSVRVTEMSSVLEHPAICAVWLIRGEIFKIAHFGRQECRQTAASAGEKLPVLFASAVSISGEARKKKNPKPT